MRLAVLTTLATVIAASSSQAAHASTIVYGCGYNICATNPNGSHHRHITRNGRQRHRYSLPRLTGGLLSFNYDSRNYLANRQARHRRELPYRHDLYGLPLSPVLSRDSRRAMFFQGIHPYFRLCDIRLKPHTRAHCPDALPPERVGWAWGPRNTLLTIEQFEGSNSFEGDDICIMANRRRCKTGLVELHDGRMFTRAPELSPNGRWLAAGAYQEGDPPKSRAYHIVLVDVRRHRLVRDLTHGPADNDPSWSPDGRRIVFRRFFYPDSGPLSTSICTASIRGGHVRCPVKKVKGELSPPTWGR